MKSIMFFLIVFLLILSFIAFIQEFIISPADGNVIVRRELAISQVAKYMRFYPTSSNQGQFCLRVEVYGRDGKSVSRYCESSVAIRVFTQMNGKGVSHLTGTQKFLLSVISTSFVSTISFAEFHLIFSTHFVALNNS